MNILRQINAITGVMVMMTILISGTANTARAEPIPELENYLSSVIEKADDAVMAKQTVGAPSEDWFFRRFLLRLRLSAGLSVPLLFKVKIIPEVELVWDRDLAEGWSTYKP